MIHGRQPGRGALLGVQVVLLAALGGLPAAPPRAQPPGGAQGLAPEELQAGLRAAEREMVAGLEALVPWCTEQRLFARREALCEEILALAPDSAVAHEGLLHARDKDGIWQPPKKK